MSAKHQTTMAAEMVKCIDLAAKHVSAPDNRCEDRYRSAVDFLIGALSVSLPTVSDAMQRLADACNARGEA